MERKFIPVLIIVFIIGCGHKATTKSGIPVKELITVFRLERAVEKITRSHPDGPRLLLSQVRKIQEHTHQVAGIMECCSKAVSFFCAVRRDAETGKGYTAGAWHMDEEGQRAGKEEQLLNQGKALKSPAAGNIIAAQNRQIDNQHLYTTGLLLIAMLLTLLALMIYLYWSDKKKAETERWQEIRKLEKYESQMKLLQERSRIAREMHDDLGSTLTTTLMAVELIKQKPNEAFPLEMISRSANQLCEQINDIIWNMNIRNDNMESLVDYILHFARSFLGEANIALTWNEHIGEENVPVEGYQRRNIYLVVKELINNIVKHANATAVQIDLAYGDNRLVIEIRDNGVGSDNYQAGDPCSGNGLLNIRKRIEQLSGEISLQNKDKGTYVYISIPI